MDMFTVMTFNLRKDSAMDRSNRWTRRRELVADFIEKSGAAIVGVQELMPSMRLDIASALRGYSVFGEGRCRKYFNEHSDILVNDGEIEVAYTKTFWLSKRPEKLGSRAFLAIFPRICTVCEAKFKDSGRKVRIFNAHFDHISGFARKIAVETILSYMEEFQKKEPLPIILMGDFNVRPGNRVISLLRSCADKYPGLRLEDVYSIAGTEPENACNTYHGFKGKITGKAHLDYIFCSDDLEPVTAYVDHSTQRGRYLSDHYPIVASLRFRA